MYIHTYVWWDKPITATNKILHNRLDIVIWDTDNKTFKVVDVCIRLDINVELRDKTKRDGYLPLVDQL